MQMDPAVAAARVAVRKELTDLRPGDLVLAAVSGGADSIALAAALAVEGPRLGLRVGAVSVDHGLQTGSADRAETVASRCRDLGLDPVLVERVVVEAAGGPEAAARDARYGALDKLGERRHAAAILLGHTLNDQAETVLLGLARGSGPRSLAGMPRRRAHYRRPFLGLRREQTVAACVALGLPVWQDPHNDDPAFTRVRARAEALPALEAAIGPGVAEALARTAAIVRADADALDDWAEAIADSQDIDVLAALPEAVRTRVLRRLAIAAGSPAGALTAEHVWAMDRLVTDWHGQKGVSLPGGLVAERSCDRLSFR